jgi:hypothetical protein
MEGNASLPVSALSKLSLTRLCFVPLNDATTIHHQTARFPDVREAVKCATTFEFPALQPRKLY